MSADICLTALYLLSKSHLTSHYARSCFGISKKDKRFAIRKRFMFTQTIIFVNASLRLLAKLNFIESVFDVIDNILDIFNSYRETDKVRRNLRLDKFLIRQLTVSR